MFSATMNARSSVWNAASVETVDKDSIDCLPVHTSEDIDLTSLVHHRTSVEHDMPLEMLEKVFRDSGVEYLALVRGERVIGVCSRRHVGVLLGARFGFAFHARSPAWHAQVEKPLVFEISTPVRQVLATALARHGEGFTEDIVLVDESHCLIGLIPAEKLAHVQTHLVAEQVTSLKRQYADLLEVHEALRQAQGLWVGLFESNLLGIALVDSKGLLQSHNRCCEQLLNLAEFSDRECTMAMLLPEKDRPNLKEFLPFGKTGAAIRREQVLQIPGRGPRTFQIAAAWIGETEQVCVCFDDITDRRMFERRMKQQEKQVLFETLVAGIAHELNNKLTPVLGFTELLESCNDHALRNTYLRSMGKSVTEAAGIIRQLLQLSRPETGLKVRVDLRDVVEESLVMLKYQMRQAGVDLHAEIPEFPVHTMADAAQLKQVIMNLAINAMHAVEKVHSPRIQLSIVTTKRGSRLSVSDNGTGMPPEILNRIFDPFFTTKAPDKGSGLGLSVCMGIVRQHGGTIEVESELGRGTRFLVSLPEAEDNISPAEAQKDVAIKGQINSCAPRRVLVVDDEEAVRKLLGELMLRQFNCQVDYAVNGSAGLDMARASDYDLIVSDIRMPEMDGMEFYETIAVERPELAKRFVFITGNAGKKEWTQGISRGQIPMLRKPFSMRDLMEVCMPLLRERTLAA